MANPLRVGIIGANPNRGWALGAHLPALDALPGFELVAVATRHEDSARATAEAFGVPHAFGDPAALIAHPDVDLVTVSVKVPHHHEWVMAALEAGKHVFCEWPLGVDIDEAVEMLELAEARGVRHVIGLQGRRSPMVNYVRDLVADGHIGELLFVSLSVEGAGRGGQITADTIWGVDKAKGGGFNVSGGHNLDTLRYLVGDLTEIQSTVAIRHPLVTVVGTGEQVRATAPDVVLVQGRLPGGALATVAIQGGLPKGFGLRLELHGADGVLVITGSRWLNFDDRTLRLSGATGDAKVEPMDVPASYDLVPDGVPAGNARNVAGLYQSVAEAASRGDDPSLLEPSFATAVSLHRFLDEIASAADLRHSNP